MKKQKRSLIAQFFNKLFNRNMAIENGDTSGDEDTQGKYPRFSVGDTTANSRLVLKQQDRNAKNRNQ
jgi:hypothetical protein